jgi:hypothetical protein
MAFDGTIVLGTIGLAFVFAYLGTKITGKHFALQTLFIFVSLILMVNASGMLGEISQLDGGSPSIFARDVTSGVSEVDTIYVAYYNVTGDLVVSNSTNGGFTWNHRTVSVADGRTLTPTAFIENNIFIITYAFYIAIAYYVVNYIYEVFLWMSKRSRRKPA